MHSIKIKLKYSNKKFGVTIKLKKNIEYLVEYQKTRWSILSTLYLILLKNKNVISFNHCIKCSIS